MLLTQLCEPKELVSTMVCCAALGCSNRSEKGVRMYGFPTDTERRKKWLVEVNRTGQDLNITKDYNNKKICEAHFEVDQFVKTKRAKIRLKPDAVPTIFGHRPVVKKRKESTPQCTPEPTKIDHVKQKQHIAADHSYSVTAEKGQSCSPRDSDITDPSQQQAKELSATSRQNDVDDALVDMIIKDSLPFSVVEDEGFRAFVKKLDPAYVLPTRHGLEIMVAARYRRTKKLTGPKETKAVLLRSLNKNS